jgi:hypothetical protein
MLQDANANNYIMAAGTNGESDKTTNHCGIANAHAYSIVDAFTMTDTNGVTHKMVMARNPWGITGYTGAWNQTDPNWTDALVSQVPMGIDPRND